MPLTATPGAKVKGWFLDQVNNRLLVVFNGTAVLRLTATSFTVLVAQTFSAAATFSSTVATGVLTAASAVITGDLKLNLTLTAGADGVGADGEQLTSGGAAAECDWSAAGSMREFKNILSERKDADVALQTLIETPVYDFQYKGRDESDEHVISTGDRKTIYTGIVADEAPWAMHHNGKILNPINALGYTVLAMKAMEARIAELEAARV